MNPEKSNLVPSASPPRTLNPFEGERSKAVASSSSSAVEMQRAQAEVYAAIMLAKQFPRDKVSSTDRILTECCREKLAEAAVYSFPRGGQEVAGPSIRLAEVLAQNWGNFQFGWDEVNRSNGVSEIIAFAWDVETNVRRTMKFFVKHWRDTKKGGYALTDERDIYELCANQAQRRVRACILNVIPGDVVEAAVDQCERTLSADNNVTKEKISSLLLAFEQIGVSKAQIEKRIGRKADGINGAIIAQLRKIYTGIREGMSKPSEFFEAEVSTPAQPLAEGQSGEKVLPADKGKQDSGADSESDWDSVVDDLLIGVNACGNKQALDDFVEENGGIIEGLSKSKATSAIKKWAVGFSKKFDEIETKK